MAFAATSHRPIEGAVATVGVSDRVAFLRKTYAHLGVALIAFAALTGGMMRLAPELSLRFSAFAFRGWHVFLTLIAFLVVGYVAQRLAYSQTSRGLQYVGLGLGVVMYSLLLQPLLWRLLIQFGSRGTGSPWAGPAMMILTQAIIITLAIFVGLTLTVFVTKKDFSFLRGFLMIALFGAIALAFTAAIFGFQLGALYSGFVILLMAGYVLYETSAVMRDFPPTHHVAAALMLFSTIATMFFHMLRLIMSLRD